jgi:NAD(P)-dependent dehydrogenase (short-subunit alcohol dehydrogenase family)
MAKSTLLRMKRTGAELGDRTMRLAGKVAIITGGGAGIGRACVELFAQERARVVIAEIDPASGEEVRDAVTKKGGSCLFVPADVTSIPRS